MTITTSVLRHLAELIDSAAPTWGSIDKSITFDRFTVDESGFTAEGEMNVDEASPGLLTQAAIRIAARAPESKDALSHLSLVKPSKYTVINTVSLLPTVYFVRQDHSSSPPGLKSDFQSRLKKQAYFLVFASEVVPPKKEWSRLIRSFVPELVEVRAHGVVDFDRWLIEYFSKSDLALLSGPKAMGFHNRLVKYVGDALSPRSDPSAPVRSCGSCLDSACCQKYPSVPVNEEEADAIASALGTQRGEVLTSEDLIGMGLILKDEYGFRVPEVLGYLGHNGPGGGGCVFLHKPEGATKPICSIYDVRPATCRSFGFPNGGDCDDHSSQLPTRELVQIRKHKHGPKSEAFLKELR